MPSSQIKKKIFLNSKRRNSVSMTRCMRAFLKVLVPITILGAVISILLAPAYLTKKENTQVKLTTTIATATTATKTDNLLA